MRVYNPSARPPPYPRDDKGKFKRGKGRVICTHFLRTGRMSVDLWKLDIRFAAENLSPAVVRGYHFWAIPYVRLMREHQWAERLMLPLVLSRAEEIAYQMGKAERPNYAGKLVRMVGEPLCWLLGQFLPEQNWQDLYAVPEERT
jgi:hypothetical protein